MSDKNNSSAAKVCLVLSALFGVLCIGALIRVELLLQEHRALIADINDRTYCLKLCQERQDISDKQSNVPQHIDTMSVTSRLRRNAVTCNSTTIHNDHLHVISIDKLCEIKSNVCTGQRGPRGKRGRKGRPGPMGKTGPQGIMGPFGPAGTQGIPGPPGPPGRDGTPGQSISAPTVTVSPPTLVVNESETVLIHCDGRGNPRPSVRWEKDKGVLDTTRMIQQQTKHGVSFEIRHVTKNDSGVYQCKGTNILGEALVQTRLEVNYSPRISLLQETVYVKYGDNVTLPACQVIGHPPPKVTWSKAFSELSENRTVLDGNRLTLLSVVKEDFGSYVCNADNILGSNKKMLLVVVVTQPKFFMTPPPLVHIVPGKTLTLDCQAKGDPSPVILWSKDNQQLPADIRASVQNGRLTVTNIQVRDSGQYVCTAISAGVFVDKVVSMVTVEYCPGGWSHFKGSCYKVIVEAASWQDCRQYCQSIGGDLAVIKSAQENSFVGKLANLKTDGSNVWIGLQRNPKTKFYWIDGSPLNGHYSNWNDGEPNFFFEKCGILYSDQNPYKWNDGRCFYKYGAICEISVAQ